FSTDDSFGDIITGNRIFNYSITGGLRRIVGAMIQAAHGTKNFQITNNFLYGVSAVGIYSYVYAGGVPIVGDVKNGIISNNILDFGGDLADGLVGTAGGGIFMSADVENVSISNNRIYNLPATPSNMAGITCTNRNIRVTDNYIDSGVTNANTSSIYIIVVDSTVKTEVVIKGNKVINRVNGIYVSGGGINNLGHPIILDGNTIDFGIGYAVDNTTNAPVNMPAIISESNYLPGAGGGFSSTLPLKRSGAATPVGAVLPQYIGEEYFNTTNSVWYKAKGTANTGWVPVSHVGGAAATVADGGTITHGFGSAPTWVLVTSSVSAEFVSVTAIAATTFTVAIKKHDGSAGTTQTIYWQAGL
ncbi:MAG: hypothetical protein KKD77_23245, partial [Gammaproteobacteria bacterium]|nr:hypothetical protein [Gammaproteobacteria bacterium]